MEGDSGTRRCKKLPAPFLSTPSGWRATAPARKRFARKRISIHALRVEGDGAAQRFPDTLKVISIHALRVEGDLEDRRKYLVN